MIDTKMIGISFHEYGILKNDIGKIKQILYVLKHTRASGGIYKYMQCNN